MVFDIIHHSPLFKNFFFKKETNNTGLHKKQTEQLNNKATAQDK